MFKLAFENLIKVAMSEHMYSFDGEIRKQQSGVAIGNVLGGALAVLYTALWESDPLQATMKVKLSL